jgi:hypothetical protein
MYIVAASYKFSRQILSDITNLAVSALLLSRVPRTSDLTPQCDVECIVTLNLTVGFTIVCLQYQKSGFTHS